MQFFRCIELTFPCLWFLTIKFKLVNYSRSCVGEWNVLFFSEPTVYELLLASRRAISILPETAQVGMYEPSHWGVHSVKEAHCCLVMWWNFRPQHGCDVTGSHVVQPGHCSQDQPVDQAVHTATAAATSQNAGELNGVSSDGMSNDSAHYVLDGCRAYVNPLKCNCLNCYTYHFYFWHSFTLALSRERQSARMSEIQNEG